MSKVIFNNRAYNSIEEASLHLRVPAKDLKIKLEKDLGFKKEVKEKYAASKETEYVWDQWGFSDCEPTQAEFRFGDIDDMVDYEMHVESFLQTLDELEEEDKEMLEAEELKFAHELAICLGAIVTQMEDMVEEEKKETAGPWVKHND